MSGAGEEMGVEVYLLHLQVLVAGLPEVERARHGIWGFSGDEEAWVYSGYLRV